MTATHSWSVGDEIELKVSNISERWKAVVVQANSDYLHIRLNQELISRRVLSTNTAIQIQQISDRGLITAPTTLSQSFDGYGLHLVVKRPSVQNIVQRRNLFRSSAALPLTLQIKDASRKDWISRRVYHHLTSDASGSGCAIETELPLAKGDRLKLTLWPDRPQIVMAGAQVAWTGPSDWPGLRRVGLSFTAISVRSQDKVVGALLEEERIRQRILERA